MPRQTKEEQLYELIDVCSLTEKSSDELRELGIGKDFIEHKKEMVMSDFITNSFADSLGKEIQKRFQIVAERQLLEPEMLLPLCDKLFLNNQRLRMSRMGDVVSLMYIVREIILSRNPLSDDSMEHYHNRILEILQNLYYNQTKGRYKHIQKAYEEQTYDDLLGIKYMFGE